MVQATTTADGWHNDEWHANLTRRLGRAVVVSLALHLGVLIVVALVRLPQHGERPLASIEVSLASLPTPPIKAIEPPKNQQKVVEPPKVQQKEKVVESPKVQQKVVDSPKPAPVPPPVKELPKPVPQSVTSAPVPVPVPVPKAAPVIPDRPVPMKLKRSNDVLHDVMKEVELPPDAPKFGDFSPAARPQKAPLKLPDIPLIPDMKEPLARASEVRPHQSLTEELSREVDEEFKKVRKLDLPRPEPSKSVAPVNLPVKPALQPVKPTPEVEAKIPSVKAIDTTLKVPGIAPGSNAYLGLVRQRISSVWSAPPVDVTGQGYVVIIKFRLHRNGTVSGVMIEQSSGNEYYDLAGKRAVVTANPLPAFPPELTESYFDAHFTFSVGEQG